MPITDYHFEQRLFFAVESGHLSGEDAEEWAQRLKVVAEASPDPIVALVDARTVRFITRAAEQAFIKASYTPNLLAVIVATNPITTVQAATIGIMGQRGYTRIFRTIEEARTHADEVLRNYPPKTL
jgi:hypothetical protein